MRLYGLGFRLHPELVEVRGFWGFGFHPGLVEVRGLGFGFHTDLVEVKEGVKYAGCNK